MNSYSGSDSPSVEFADSFTWIHGKHTIGLGFDIRLLKLIRNLDDDFYGDWSFSFVAHSEQQSRIVPTPRCLSMAQPR